MQISTAHENSNVWKYNLLCLTDRFLTIFQVLRIKCGVEPVWLFTKLVGDLMLTSHPISSKHIQMNKFNILE